MYGSDGPMRKVLVTTVRRVVTPSAKSGAVRLSGRLWRVLGLSCGHEKLQDMKTGIPKRSHCLECLVPDDG